MSQIVDWMARAKPGDQFVYYSGDLAYDRYQYVCDKNLRGSRATASLSLKRSDALTCADDAYTLCSEKRVHLIQRRNRYVWDYVAIKR